MSFKSVMLLLEKNKLKKLKKVIKKRYDGTGKKHYGPSGKKTRKCPQKALRSFFKKVKKLKNVLKKRYSPFRKKRKMCLKSITALLEKIKKGAKCPQRALLSFYKKMFDKSKEFPQKALQPFWKKSWQMCLKNITVLLEKSKKLKNVLKKHYRPSGKKLIKKN